MVPQQQPEQLVFNGPQHPVQQQQQQMFEQQQQNQQQHQQQQVLWLAGLDPVIRAHAQAVMGGGQAMLARG